MLTPVQHAANTVSTVFYVRLSLHPEKSITLLWVWPMRGKRALNWSRVRLRSIASVQSMMPLYSAPLSPSLSLSPLLRSLAVPLSYSLGCHSDWLALGRRDASHLSFCLLAIWQLSVWTSMCKCVWVCVACVVWTSECVYVCECRSDSLYLVKSNGSSSYACTASC